MLACFHSPKQKPADANDQAFMSGRNVCHCCPSRQDLAVQADDQLRTLVSCHSLWLTTDAGRRLYVMQTLIEQRTGINMYAQEHPSSFAETVTSWRNLTCRRPTLPCIAGRCNLRAQNCKPLENIMQLAKLTYKGLLTVFHQHGSCELEQVFCQQLC